MVESIGASMFSVVEEDEEETDSETGESTDGESTTPKKKKSNEIKTPTMTIVPTPLTEETLNEVSNVLHWM